MAEVEFIDTVEESTKEKRHKNAWLEDKQFISRMRFHDHHYMRELLKMITGHIRRVPVHVVTHWEWRSKEIVFTVGKHSKGFTVSTDIPIYDYMFYIDKWLEQFFPQYEVTVEYGRGMTEDEIEASIVSGDCSLDEAIEKRVIDTRIEQGIIRRIMLIDDQFKLDINDKSYIRLSGTPKNPMPLSVLLDNLRLIEKSEDIRNYIFENSTLIKEQKQKNRVDITYTGNGMLNFFIIHHKYLKENMPVYERDDTGEFEVFGKFWVKYDSDFHRGQCHSILKREDPELIVTDKYGKKAIS